MKKIILTLSCFLSLHAFAQNAEVLTNDSNKQLYPIFSYDGAEYLNHPCYVKLKNGREIMFTALMDNPENYKFEDKVVLAPIYEQDIEKYIQTCEPKKD